MTKARQPRPTIVHLWLLIIFFTVLIGSAIRPHDYFTWFLEAAPAILAAAILFIVYRRFRFTALTNVFILLHCCILFVGAKYTYAEVPLFNWLAEILHHSRNNYDKLGHFTQGFVPALVTRELQLRWHIVNGRKWVAFFTLCVCLSISALYELLEWLVAELSGQSAEAFLGTQGYVWDTQSDMLFALIGAISMLILLSRIQDRQIEPLMCQPR